MLVGFHYNNNEYFYSRDLTGNITKILDVYGNIKVEYKYDAWGKVLSIIGDNTIKNVNSYLYKGYYYDFETELYYCNSRYYDPDVCRWISIDESSFLDYDELNGINLWCYCGNNPIINVDEDGSFFLTIVRIIAVSIVAAVFVAATVNDIYQIASGNVDVDVDVNPDSITDSNVAINDSYKILTPLMRYGYSFYLNHINSKTRDIIKGTSFGIEYEWRIHNVVYYGGKALKFVGVENLFGKSIEGLIEQSSNVDIGASIFEDNHDAASGILHLGYLVHNPFGAIHDLLLYWWRKVHDD